MEGIKTEKNAPPSPALSNHDLPHGLGELLMHNAANPQYAHDQVDEHQVKYQSE